MCLDCLNAPEGIAWRKAKRAADLTYDPYLTLIAVRLPTACPECGQPIYVSAKARGMASARWDVNCLKCHRHRPEPLYAFGEAGAAFDALQRVEQDFIHSRGLADIDHQVAAIARAYDHLVGSEPCPCGGRLSLTAKPRCPRCDAIAFDSCFHVVQERG